MIATNKCTFCGNMHIEYGDKSFRQIPYWYHKSSYELLIMILKDLKEFVIENKDEPTLRDSVICFCKYSMLICEEDSVNRKNGFTEFYGSVFTGVIRLMDELNTLELTSEFIDGVCRKLWMKHEELLARINTEESKKTKYAR